MATTNPKGTRRTRGSVAHPPAHLRGYLDEVGEQLATLDGDELKAAFKEAAANVADYAKVAATTANGWVHNAMFKFRAAASGHKRNPQALRRAPKGWDLFQGGDYLDAYQAARTAKELIADGYEVAYMRAIDHPASDHGAVIIYRQKKRNGMFDAAAKPVRKLTRVIEIETGEKGTVIGKAGRYTKVQWDNRDVPSLADPSIIAVIGDEKNPDYFAVFEALRAINDEIQALAALPTTPGRHAKLRELQARERQLRRKLAEMEGRPDTLEPLGITGRVHKVKRNGRFWEDQGPGEHGPWMVHADGNQLVSGAVTRAEASRIAKEYRDKGIKTLIVSTGADAHDFVYVVTDTRPDKPKRKTRRSRNPAYTVVDLPGGRVAVARNGHVVVGTTLPAKDRALVEAHAAYLNENHGQGKGRKRRNSREDEYSAPAFRTYDKKAKAVKDRLIADGFSSSFATKAIKWALHTQSDMWWRRIPPATIANYIADNEYLVNHSATPNASGRKRKNLEPASAAFLGGYLFDQAEKAVTKKPRVTRRRKMKRNHARTLNPDSPIDKISNMFQGEISGKTQYVEGANGTPDELARIGKLDSFELKDGTLVEFEKAFLGCDKDGDLHIVGIGLAMPDHASPTDTAVNDLGEIEVVNYTTAKRHITDGKVTHFYHNFGEDTGVRPHLVIDHEGMPILAGGEYDVRREGIVN